MTDHATRPHAATASHELTLDDIADLRAYENERDGVRSRVIALKKRRRVAVGAFQTLVFENRDTMRFQVQEMARAERIISDEGIETELRIYNPLITRPGHLSATLFLELTSDGQLREWLPKLVGVERSYQLHLGEGAGADVVGARVDQGHADTLTRAETTACVHYLWWPLTPGQVDRLEAGPARLVCTHPAYREEATLTDTTRASIVADLRPSR